ncbi:MAG: hypothetical protein ACHQDC_08435 [Acidimicrobiales bacterium]
MSAPVVEDPNAVHGPSSRPLFEPEPTLVDLPAAHQRRAAILIGGLAVGLVAVAIVAVGVGQL